MKNLVIRRHNEIEKVATSKVETLRCAQSDGVCHFACPIPGAYALTTCNLCALRAFFVSFVVKPKGACGAMTIDQRILLISSCYSIFRRE